MLKHRSNFRVQLYWFTWRQLSKRWNPGAYLPGCEGLLRHYKAQVCHLKSVTASILLNRLTDAGTGCFHDSNWRLRSIVHTYTSNNTVWLRSLNNKLSGFRPVTCSRHDNEQPFCVSVFSYRKYHRLSNTSSLQQETPKIGSHPRVRTFSYGNFSETFSQKSFH